jgi:hypothetical protein
MDAALETPCEELTDRGLASRRDAGDEEDARIGQGLGAAATA